MTNYVFYDLRCSISFGPGFSDELPQSSDLQNHGLLEQDGVKSDLGSQAPHSQMRKLSSESKSNTASMAPGLCLLCHMEKLPFQNSAHEETQAERGMQIHQDLIYL